MINNIMEKRGWKDFLRYNLFSLFLVIGLIIVTVVIAGDVVVKEGNFIVNTSNFFVNSSSGKVGIGTANPVSYDFPALHIYSPGAAGNNYFEGLLHVGGASTTLGAQLAYHALSSGRVSLTNLNNAGGGASTLSFGFGTINSSGRPANEVMSIDQTRAITMSGNLSVDGESLNVDASNNRVGVGTTPSYPLH